ncbi:MAG: hypothetical protein IKI55_00995 [Bacilli bacterium]|nr:hypothetical protein [Bacilli bacterium]
MKRKSILFFASVLALGACANALQESSSQADTWVEVKDSDKVFGFLDEDIKPILLDDKQEATIKQKGDKPLFAMDFETGGDLSFSSEEPSSNSELKPYRIEFFGEASTKAFGLTKEHEFKTETHFENAKVSLSSKGEDLTSITQTFSTYIAETKKSSDPLEYEQGLYLDLSHAKLTRIIFEEAFGEGTVLEDRIFIDLSSSWSSFAPLFPLVDVLDGARPYFIDALKDRYSNKKLSLKTDEKGHYSLFASIESKEDFADLVKDPLDKLFDRYVDIASVKTVVDGYIDDALREIKSIKGSLSIPFTVTSVGDIGLELNVEMNEKKKTDSSEAEDSSDFAVKSLSFSSEIALSHGNEVDVSDFPSDLLDHNVWKEFEA